MLFELIIAHPFLLFAILLILGCAIGTVIGFFADRFPHFQQKQWVYQCKEFLDIEPREAEPKLSQLLRMSNTWSTGKHLAVTLLSGLSVVSIVAFLGLNIESLGITILFFLLLTASLIDLEHQLLPDLLTYPILWIGLIFSVESTYTTPIDSILGAVTGFMFLWVLNAAHEYATKRTGMGGGDFKLLAGLAAWVGIGYLPVILAIAAISGLIITFIQIALNNSKLSSRVPFGPYLSFAGIITITNLESLACFSMFMP